MMMATINDTASLVNKGCSGALYWMSHEVVLVLLNPVALVAETDDGGDCLSGYLVHRVVVALAASTSSKCSTCSRSFANSDQWC